jgi:hypothetical protein
MVRDAVNSTVSNKEYFDSLRWKCEKSPSGAHHWIIKYDQMTCKYCTETRPILVTSQSETSK